MGISARPVPYDRIPSRVYRVQHNMSGYYEMATKFSPYGLVSQLEGRKKLFEQDPSEDVIREALARHADWNNREPSPFISLRTCGFHARSWGYIQCNKNSQGTVLFLVIDTDKLKRDGALFFRGTQPHELLVCGTISSSAILLGETENLRTRLPVKSYEIGSQYTGYWGGDHVPMTGGTTELEWKLRYLLNRRDHATRQEVDANFLDLGCGEHGGEVLHNGTINRRGGWHDCPVLPTGYGLPMKVSEWTTAEERAVQTDNISVATQDCAVQTEQESESEMVIADIIEVSTQTEGSTIDSGVQTDSTPAADAATQTLSDLGDEDTNGLLSDFARLGMEPNNGTVIVRVNTRSLTPSATPEQISALPMPLFAFIASCDTIYAITNKQRILFYRKAINRLKKQPNLNLLDAETSSPSNEVKVLYLASKDIIYFTKVVTVSNPLRWREVRAEVELDSDESEIGSIYEGFSEPEDESDWSSENDVQVGNLEKLGNMVKQ